MLIRHLGVFAVQGLEEALGKTCKDVSCKKEARCYHTKGNVEYLILYNYVFKKGATFPNFL